MLKKTDKLIQLLLYSPHISDFIYQREDGTYYADRRNEGSVYVEVTKVDEVWVFGDPVTLEELSQEHSQHPPDAL